MSKLRSVRLEAAAVCQLKCPACSTGTNKNAKALGRGYLTAKMFYEFITKNPTVANIELSNYGEIFLNPELAEIFRIASECNVILSATNGVNLNHASAAALEAAVKYKVKHIKVSIDGACQSTYEIYRVRGDFDSVIRNIEMINLFKAKYGQELPSLTWQFVLFGHNEHEVPIAKDMADRLGMKFFVKKSWNEDLSPIKDEELVRKHTGWRYLRRSDYEHQSGTPYNTSICNQLWDEPQINWDGRLLGCSVNSWKDFGVNVFEIGLDSAMNSEQILYARKMISGEAVEREDIPCSSCKKFLLMKASKNYHSRLSKEANWRL